MEVDQLRTFVAVVTFGGFRRAAEVLFVSQPAVRPHRGDRGRWLFGWVEQETPARSGIWNRLPNTACRMV